MWFTVLGIGTWNGPPAAAGILEIDVGLAHPRGLAATLLEHQPRFQQRRERCAESALDRVLEQYALDRSLPSDTV